MKYLFTPSLRPSDRNMLNWYNLKYIKENRYGTVVSGAVNDLNRFANQRRGEEINERYLMEEVR